MLRAIDSLFDELVKTDEIKENTVMRSFDYIRQTEDKNILIASHRGVSGGNIPCNSLEAFEIALRQ